MMKIYNSLTKQKEDFIPLNNKTVNMYSCGVTVYDKCHIGHARSLYIFDMIKNYLSFRGYQVNFVRNITDVDDKIINKAQDTKRTFEDVVAENIGFYETDLANLGIPQANAAEPRATENIDGMIRHIQGLIDKGYAYEAGGDVYFRVRNFKEYGKLSGQSVEKMLEAVRIEQDLKKQDPLDFVLWKKAKDGEPRWSSPWGDGRPGWHIECSVMSLQYLKCETLDIHAGGRDLIFPHHENEIAQAEALTGKPFAKYWIHHGLLKINGQKMAKSLGNFITVEDAVKRFEVDDIKWFFLNSHYRSEIDFTPEKIAEAHKNLEKIRAFLKRKEIADQGLPDDGITSRFSKNILEAMDDDFNTPKAIGMIFEFLTEANKILDETATPTDEILRAGAFIRNLLSRIFCLHVERETEIPSEVTTLVARRQEAKKAKNYQLADDIRDQILAKGFMVKDTKEGSTVSRL